MSNPQLFTVAKGFNVENIDDVTKESSWLNGGIDPSVSPGVPAPISSIYTRNISGADAALYQKFGPNAVDWKPMAAGSSQAGIIGAAEDGDYTDGLFTDFVPTTPVGVPVDRFNEILKALAPSPAPFISAISLTQTGVSGKLSFGASHAISGYTNVSTTAGNSAVDINGSYTQSGTRAGLFATTATKSGTLASGSPAKGAHNYPANSFGPGDSGTLKLEVNGTVVQTTDLSTFVSGASVNANGSGFTLSAATATQFEDTTSFPQFKYRTGTYSVAGADQRNGFNFIRVIHTVSGTDHATGYFEWVVDTNATAITASSGTLNTLVMSGTKNLSGVKYHTSGTAAYGVTIDAAYRDVYSPSASAVSFQGTNCSAPAQALANCSTEGDSVVVSGKTVTVATGSRLLNAAIAVSVGCLHPLKTALSGGESHSISGLLLDAISTANTDLVENFCLEDYRVPSVALGTVNGYAAQADASAASWTSTTSIAAGSASGYADGLLDYNGALRYPTQGLTAGDFRNVADGNASGPANGPSGNPNYSASSGTRYFYRKFKNNSGLTKANFSLFVSGTASFASVVSGPSGQALTMELKFPLGSISTATGWMDAYADFATGQWTDGSGARSATLGVGRATGTTWGLTLGTKSIAANEWIVVRLAAPSTWTGNISSISLTWL